MAKKNRSNLNSPINIGHTCNLADLGNWFCREAAAVPEAHVRSLILTVHEHIDSFVQWPMQAVLLWEGSNRMTKYHRYPTLILNHAREKKLILDSRVNGPAIAAFRIAGGIRPPRFGSNNAWSVHHIYSGKFPYVGRESTLHAAYCGLHCTQSAGLVAIHPIADQMCDEYPFFAWLLRAIAFQRFSYDPDHVFTTTPCDLYGFSETSCSVISPTLANTKTD